MRYVIIGPADKISNLNQIAAQLDPDTGGDKSFGVSLSVDGTDPATHVASNTLMSDEVWAQAESYLDTLTFPVSIYKIGRKHGPGKVYRYDSGSWVYVDEGWIFDVATGDMALQRIQTEVI